MKRVYIVTIVTCAVFLTALVCLLRFLNLAAGREDLIGNDKKRCLVPPQRPRGRGGSKDSKDRKKGTKR